MHTESAHLAAAGGELKKALEEYSELQQEHLRLESNLASEHQAFQTESAAFTHKLQDHHNEQSAYNTVLEELRSFQKAYRTNRIDKTVWERIKSWNSWVGHYQSEESVEIRKKHKQRVPSHARAPLISTLYACWHCGFRTYLSNQCVNWRCNENSLMIAEKESGRRKLKN